MSPIDIKKGDRFLMPIGVAVVISVGDNYAHIEYKLPSGAIKREAIEIKKLRKCEKI